ncbi:MAG: Twitching mobility protein [Fimbriimonadales bacterium]|nr:MAG: type IV pilus twitching motility protein PilT [Armatimonadota bacterium]MBV6501984.1 Twitching mobility protein [Fimbriimonadales bacterium]MCE7898820.1 type IV pilus twitching motility protein PilT [Armatimonadetes bacterium ATM1]MDL1928884.1 type IV pilus twitching motility protein PilT [Fimbriimonadia bacterium ATM]MBC6969551.1 type IV pilus twitching motility protein PilT [Armatimonadota bacterium]
MSKIANATLHELLEIAFGEKASDLFIKAGSVPKIRQHALVKPLPGEWEEITEDDARRLILSTMNQHQAAEFERNLEMDLAFGVGGKMRIRANLYFQRGSYAGVFRLIPLEILSVEQLGLPPVLNEFAKYRQGLVLFTGPTGSGKTTSLAAILDLVNRTRQCHIVTIEDPLEFVHADKAAYISQREVHIDTKDFFIAMRAAVREAPDVILVGEMRDVETMNVALQAGETGHLVFSTVHTPSCAETLDRVVNMFPPHEKNHLCMRLAGSLRAVVSQKLVPRADGQGRVCACEVMICTPTVSKLIEDGHFGELYHAISEGHFWGMQTMNQSLVKYVKAGVITEETALSYAGIISELRQLLRR